MFKLHFDVKFSSINMSICLSKFSKSTIPDSKVHGPKWGPSGADRTQVGPMLAPWTLLSGMFWWLKSQLWSHNASAWELSANHMLQCITMQVYKTSHPIVHYNAYAVWQWKQYGSLCQLYHKVTSASSYEEYIWSKASINTSRPRQNGRHFPDDTFKRIFLNENVRISIKISLKFVPTGPINKIPALIQIMAWRRPVDKPLTVTQPQWVKNHITNFLMKV